MAWFSTSSGRIELKISKSNAQFGCHQGQCDDDVLELSKKPAIARQLKKIDPALLRDELREYGAWDDAELQDHDANLMRILWIACGDINDSQD